MDDSFELPELALDEPDWDDPFPKTLSKAVYIEIHLSDDPLDPENLAVATFSAEAIGPSFVDPEVLVVEGSVVEPWFHPATGD